MVLNLQSKVTEIDYLSIGNFDEFVISACEIITQTADSLQPPKSRKRVKNIRCWTPIMTEILNRSKYHYWMWRQEGTSDKLSIHYRQMRVLKEKLRAEKRKIESAKRQSKFTDIMSLSDRNDKNFYTLINNQRNLRSSVVTSILKYDNKIINTEEEILDTWASYYEKLATPVDNPDFDDTYKLIVEQDISALTDTYTNNRDTLAPVSEKEVVQIINSLKNGKAPDASRVTCEHLKFGGKTLSYVLTSIITFSFSNHIIPTVFKNGLACPVFKKKGKPKEDPGSYRKITITNPVGKLTEKLHLVRNKDNISNIQSPLQKGFTQGEIPLVAALILTELHTEAKENGNPLIIALTDAKRVPTVADDVTLVSNCPYEIQSMLDLQTFHANKYRYLISSQKSCVLNYRCADSFDWSINGEILDTPENAVHLGIKRDKLSRLGTKEVVPGRIQLARQTVYSLMGAGLYGLNGVNPKVSLHLIRCYVIPRLLYGLEVILLSKTDISNLTIYFVKLLKRIQHLPDRTANAAVLLLIGQIPIEAEIHKRILGIFRNIIDNDNSVERDLAFRQLAMKTESSNSWFRKVVTITELYDLPSPHDLLVNPPSKSKWKKLVNSLVNYYWITKLKSEASEKSSLNLLNYTDAEFGSIHSIWNTCGSEPYSTLRACIKSKLACNTYTLQCDKSKFSKRQISAICPLCGIEDENRLHFILRCSSLDNVRNSFIQSLKTFIKDVVTTNLYDELFCSEINTLQLIIDCSVFHFLSRGDVFKVECITRGLCFKLHQQHRKSTRNPIFYNNSRRMSHEVEETLKRIQTHPGVVGTIVVNNEGIPIRTTLDNPTTVQYAGLIQSLTAKARSAIRDIDPQNDLTFLRIRSKKHEIMVAPEKEYLLISGNIRNTLFPRTRNQASHSQNNQYANSYVYRESQKDTISNRNDYKYPYNTPNRKNSNRFDQGRNSEAPAGNTYQGPPNTYYDRKLADSIASAVASVFHQYHEFGS
ncbi:DNCL2 [Mytilus edulis]|uniref:DYNLRB n=1 Tax=Mytilus edulis TaxID=6550 RepID=A0A8S3UG64_MYTED|nr:DNCL2 [Mytilus edulis]